MDQPQKRKKLKLLAGLCAVTFFAQDLAWAAPDFASAAGVSAVKPPMPAVRFTLPESVGSIEDFWQAPVSTTGRDGRLVILIQDAHTNASGQLNLARALERILPAESIRTVYTEGAEGDVSLRFLRDRVAARTLDGVLLEYVKKGVVKGDDYWNAVSEHDFALRGVEDMDLYRESLEVYSRTVKLRADVRPYLDRTLRSALSLEEKIHTPAMRRLEASRQARRSGERSEADHIAFLLQSARAEGLDLSRFRNTVLFEKYRRLEDRLDSDRLAREQREAFGALSEADRQELQPALDASVRSPMDTAYARAFGLALREKLGPAVSKYPELKKYFSYLSKVSKIHFAALLEEGRGLEDALVRRLAVTADAVTLHETVRSLEDLSDLIQFKIAPQEFSRLDRLRAFSDLRPLTGWINAKLAESGRNPELAVFLEREAFEAIRSARRFYELTYERDRVMLDRTIARMDTAGETRAVLIAGGFHAPGLKTRLREAGISYVSVMPQVLHETDAARYEKLLLAQLRPAEASPASTIRVASAAGRDSDPASPLSPSTSSARLGAPLLGPDGARLSAALGDPRFVDVARQQNRSARGGFGFGTGLLTRAAKVYQQSFAPERFKNSGFSASERDLMIHALVKIGEKSLYARSEIFDDPDMNEAILQYRPIDLDRLIRKMQEQKRSYESRLDLKGRRMFSAKEIEELLFKRLIPIEWVDYFFSEGLSKTSAKYIMIKQTDPKGVWREIKKPVRDELVQSGLSPTNAMTLVLGWSNPKEMWETVRPIRDELVQSGLSPTHATSMVLKWSDPKETWETVLKPIRDELVQSGLSPTNVMTLILGWSNPKETWETVLKPIRDGLVQSGLSATYATTIVLAWSNPKETWETVLKPIRDGLVQSGLSVTHATILTVRWSSNAKETWEKTLKPVRDELVQSGLSEYNATTVVLRWSDPKKTWETVLRPIRDEIEGSDFSREEATYIVLASSDPKRKAEALRQVLHDLSANIGSRSINQMKLMLLRMSYSNLLQYLTQELRVAHDVAVKWLEPLRLADESSEAGDVSMAMGVAAGDEVRIEFAGKNRFQVSRADRVSGEEQVRTFELIQNADLTVSDEARIKEGLKTLHSGREDLANFDRIIALRDAATNEVIGFVNYSPATQGNRLLINSSYVFESHRGFGAVQIMYRFLEDVTLADSPDKTVLGDITRLDETVVSTPTARLEHLGVKTRANFVGWEDFTASYGSAIRDERPAGARMSEAGDSPQADMPGPEERTVQYLDWMKVGPSEVTFRTVTADEIERPLAPGSLFAAAFGGLAGPEAEAPEDDTPEAGPEDESYDRSPYVDENRVLFRWKLDTVDPDMPEIDGFESYLDVTIGPIGGHSRMEVQIQAPNGWEDRSQSAYASLGDAGDRQVRARLIEIMRQYLQPRLSGSELTPLEILLYKALKNTEMVEAWNEADPAHSELLQAAEREISRKAIIHPETWQDRVTELAKGPMSGWTDERYLAVYGLIRRGSAQGQDRSGQRDGSRPPLPRVLERTDFHPRRIYQAIDFGWYLQGAPRGHRGILQYAVTEADEWKIEGGIATVLARPSTMSGNKVAVEMGGRILQIEAQNLISFHSLGSESRRRMDQPLTQGQGAEDVAFDAYSYLTMRGSSLEQRIATALILAEIEENASHVGIYEDKTLAQELRDLKLAAEGDADYRVPDADLSRFLARYELPPAEAVALNSPVPNNAESREPDLGAVRLRSKNRRYARMRSLVAPDFDLGDLLASASDDASGARMATDRDLVGRRMSDGTEISERLIEHIRLRMGVDDLAADQRLDDDPAGALERAFKAVDRIWIEVSSEGLDPADLTQEEFNRRFGLMPVMLAAGLTTRFSAYIPKHLAQGGMDRTVISHALEGTYHSPGVKPVVYLGLKHLGLIVRDEYLTGYDTERHMFLVEPAITAFEGGNRAVRIDPKYIDPEKEKRYFGRSGAATMAFVRPLGHGDNVLQAITAVVPDGEHPYIQVAFGETANASLKTQSNASFISYLEIVGTDAEAVAGARKLKPEEQVSVKGNFFFNGDRDRLMAYTDFEQIPHTRPTGRYDLVAHQTGAGLEKVKEELGRLPEDPGLRSDAIRRIRAEHPYFAISDDGAIFDQEGLVKVVEDVRRWKDVPEDRREWILKHFAVRESADRSSADFLIPSNTTTYRVGTIRSLAATVDRLRIEGGFDRDDVADPRINLFWSVEPKDGAVKTLAWNYVRLASDRAISEDRPIRARIAYVGERSPSSIKDPAALGKFVGTAIASKNTGLAQAPVLEDSDRAEFNAVRARLVRGEVAVAKVGIHHVLLGSKGIEGFRTMIRALLADSSAQSWQGTLLMLIEDLQTKMLAPGAPDPGTGQGAHAPPLDLIVHGILEQLVAEAVDAGWIGNNPHALVSDPVYAEAISRLRNRYAAELQRLRDKDLKVMSKTSRAEYLLDRLAETVGSGLSSLQWDLAALSAFRDRFDQDAGPHIPVLAVVGSVDDGGSSESNKVAIERMGYGLIPAPGDQAHSMEGLMSEDKTRHLMGEGGRIESGASLTDGVMPFIWRSVTDPGVTMQKDFFLFAAAVMASAMNVDRMNRESAAMSRDDEPPAQIGIRGASIRNIFLIGFLREAGLLTSASSENRMRSAVKGQNDMVLYQRAMSEMARAAGINGFEAAVSSFNPATLYAVYSGYTLMLRPASSAGHDGKLIPVVIEPGEDGSIVIRNPQDPGRDVTLVSRQEASMGDLGLDFEGLVIGNIDGRIYLKVDGMPWTLNRSHPDHPMMMNPDGGLKYLALDGTGRDIEFQGTSEKTPLFTAVSGDVYLVPPIIKKQTFITEFPNHGKLLRVGLLDGYGISGKVRQEPVRQPANEPLLRSIRGAGPGDMIVIGPGSHFTSIIPHFLVDGFPEALRAAKERGAEVIYVMNGVYDNETNRHSPEELLAAVEEAAGIPLDSMITTVSGSAPESDESLAARSGIDVEALRGVIHTPGDAELRSDDTAASEAAKKGRALIYLKDADQEAVRRRWPGMNLIAVAGSLRVKRVQKRKAGEYDLRVVHEPDAILESVVRPAARGVRPGRLIAVTGGSAVSALWAGVSRKLLELPSHSRDVRPGLMKRIEEALGPGRFRIYPGGFASIDITPAGIDKSTAIKDLLTGGSDAVYFGDEFFDLGQKTGNDIPVIKAGSELKDKHITIFSVDKDPAQRTAEAKRHTIWIGAGPRATRRVLSKIREAVSSGEKQLTIKGEGPDAERQVVLDLDRIRSSGSLVFDVDGTILGSKNDNFENSPEIRELFVDLLGAGLKLAIISGNSRSEQKKRVSDALSGSPDIERLTLYVNGGATRMRFDASGGADVFSLSGDLSEADVQAVVGAVREAARADLGLDPLEIEAWKNWFGFDGVFGYRADFGDVKFRPFWASAGFEPQVVTADQMAGETGQAAVDQEDSGVVSMPFVEVRDGVQLSVKLLPKQVDLRSSPSSGARMSIAAEPDARLRRAADVVVEPAADPIVEDVDASGPVDHALNRLSDWFEANYGEPPVIETVFDQHSRRFWATALSYDGHELMIRKSDQIWNDTTDTSDPVYHVMVDKDMEGYIAELNLKLDAEGRVDAEATIEGLFIKAGRKQKHPWAETLLKRWVRSMDGLTLDRSNPFFGRHPVASVSFDTGHPGFPVYKPGTYDADRHGVRKIGSPVAETASLEAPVVSDGRKRLVFYGGLGAVVPRFYMEYLKRLALEYDVVYEAVDLLPEDAARQKIDAMELPYAAYHHASRFKIDPKDPPAGIVILTRPDSHFDITRWANENGVPVFVEKPITLPGSVGAMRDHFRQHPDELFAIDFFFDNPSAREAIRLIDAGKIGRIQSIRGEMIEENPIEKGREWLVIPEISGGGLGMDMLVHLTALAEMVLERWGRSLRHAELDPQKIVLARYDGAPPGTESYARIEGTVEKDIRIQFGAGKGLDRSAYYLVVEGELGEIEINLGTEHAKGFMEFRPKDGGQNIRIENSSSDIGYNGTTRKMVHSLHVPGEITRREREFRMEATSLSVWLMNTAQIMNGPVYQTIPLHQDPAQVIAKDVGQATLSDREQEAIRAMGQLNRGLSDHFERLQMKVDGAPVEVADYLAVLVGGSFVIDLEPSLGTRELAGSIVRGDFKADWRPLDAEMKKAAEASGWTWVGLKRYRYPRDHSDTYAQAVEGIWRAYQGSAEAGTPGSFLVMVHGDPGSGKTTFIEQLTEALRGAGLKVHREDDRYMSHHVDTFQRMVDLNSADIMIYEQVDRQFQDPERIDLVVEFRVDESTRLDRIHREDTSLSNLRSVHSGDLWTVPVYAQALAKIPVYQIDTTAATAIGEIREQIRSGISAAVLTEGARLARHVSPPTANRSAAAADPGLIEFAARSMRERGLNVARMAHQAPGRRLAVYDLHLNGQVFEMNAGARFARRIVLEPVSASGPGAPRGQGVWDPTDAIHLKSFLDAQADQLAAASGLSDAVLDFSVRVPVETLFAESLDGAELRSAAQYLVDEVLAITGPSGAEYARTAVFYLDPDQLDRLDVSGRPGARDAVRVLRSAAAQSPERFVVGRPDSGKPVVNWLAVPEGSGAAPQGIEGEFNVNLGQIRQGALPSFRMGLAAPYTSVLNTVGAGRWKEFFELQDPAQDLDGVLTAFEGFGTAVELLSTLQGKMSYRPEQRLKFISFSVGARLTEVFRALLATARSA